MKFLIFTSRVLLVLSTLITIPVVTAGPVLGETHADSANESPDCVPPQCTHVNPASGLQPIFVATASVAPAIGEYSFSDATFNRHFKGRANFIGGDMSLGWSFIDPKTDHFSHTLLIRGNLQSTLIPAKMGDKTDLAVSGVNLYQDQTLTRTDQSLELFYKLGIKKHNMMLSVGHKQSETKFSSNESAWANSVSVGNVIVNPNSSVTVVDKSKVLVDASGRGSVLTGVKDNYTYTKNSERLSTKGAFVGFGYDYQINEAQNMRLGANVSYMFLNAKRQLDSYADDSDKAKSIKWGIYLQGEMLKLDRYGKLTYTLAYDNIKYDMHFPNPSSNVQEKLQTLSFSVNYIFF